MHRSVFILTIGRLVLVTLFLVVGVTETFGQLDDRWTVTVNGQTVPVEPNGSFLISNVSAPDLFGLGGPGTPVDFLSDDVYRLTGVRDTGSGTLYVYSPTAIRIKRNDVTPFPLGAFLVSPFPPPLPESISLQVDCAAPQAPPLCGSVITPIGSGGQCPNTIPCAVPLKTIAKLTDGSQQDVTSPLMRTTYRTSNANIARIVGDHPDLTQATMFDVEGVSPGEAFITATNGGATSVIRITVANPNNIINTTVEGFVRDVNGLPLSGATIRVLETGTGGQLLATGTSDSNGFFQIAPVVAPTDPNTGVASPIVVQATIAAGGTASTTTPSLAPVPGGFTDAGIITIDIVCDTPWSTAFGPTTLNGKDIFAFALFDDDGPGPEPEALYVGGSFTIAGGTVANNIAKWNGQSWEPLIDGTGVNGVDQAVHAISVVDLQDGNGPALYAAGFFVMAGGTPANKIARWDGTNWTAISAGVGFVNDTAYAVASFDAGSGPELYVGGAFSVAGPVVNGNCVSGNNCVPALGIAKWNPTTMLWSDVGGGTNAGGLVRTLISFDDGSGTSLYVGGRFFQMNGANVRNVGRWNGTGWTEVGPGGLSGFNDIVNILTIFDFDGTIGPNPPELFAGGSFGFSPALDVAKWDGSVWEPLGPGLNNEVTSLVGVDDGVNRTLYATGLFDKIGVGGSPVEKIAVWDGMSWSNVGTGIETFEAALGVFDDGSGPALLVGGGQCIANCGGGITSREAKRKRSDRLPSEAHTKTPSLKRAPAVNQGYVAKWKNSQWSVLGNGLNDEVKTMIVFDDDGSGPNTSSLYAGGRFAPPPGPDDNNAPPFKINAIARFDGTNWSSLRAGIDCISTGCNASVNALAVFDEDGAGMNPPRLFTGGTFAVIGGVSVNNLARWDGVNWSAIGNVGGAVESLAVFDDGSGAALCAGGGFPGGIKMWDGATWTTLGSGIAAGGTVFAMAAFDDGSGMKLYVGGNFSDAGGIAGTTNLASWDGSTWSVVQSAGLGLNGSVYALTVYDDSLGPALFASGEFLAAGGSAVNRVAKWNGSTWSRLDNGLGPISGSARVDTLFGFDDGSGMALYAGGDFTSAFTAGVGTVPLNRLAKWAGLVWLPVGVSTEPGSDPGGGVDGTGTVNVQALAVFDDGVNGPALFTGGAFETAAGVPSSNVAKLGCR